MTIRSMKWAASVSLFAAVLAVGTTLPERQAAAQVQAVPRAGLAFNDTITQRVTIESVDPEVRTVAFTLPDGQLVAAPVAGSVSNLAAIQDGSVANVTYDQVVTILNLRQKGPGSKEERRESMGKPSAADIDSGRFTVTVVGVDLANITVSVIDGIGGVVRTYKANTPAKRIYLAVQLMYTARDPRLHHETYFILMRELVQAAPSAWPHIVAVSNRILAGELYKALKSAKTLIAYEKELVDHATRGTNLRRGRQADRKTA